MQTTRKLGSWRSFLAMGENVLGGLFLFALAFIPIIEIILRRITGSGLIWSPGFLQHAVIWVAWLGGMSASREAAHLSLSSSGNPGNHIDYIAFIIRSITATAINTAFAIASISFIIMGFTPDEKIGMLPTRLILVILPIGYAVMAVRVFTCRRKKSPLYLALGLLIGLDTLLACPGQLSVHCVGGNFQYFLRFRGFLVQCIFLSALAAHNNTSSSWT